MRASSKTLISGILLSYFNTLCLVVSLQLPVNIAYIPLADHCIIVVVAVVNLRYGFHQNHWAPSPTGITCWLHHRVLPKCIEYQGQTLQVVVSSESSAVKVICHTVVGSNGQYIVPTLVPEGKALSALQILSNSSSPTL